MLGYFQLWMAPIIHNAGVGGSSPPVATTSNNRFSLIFHQVSTFLRLCKLGRFLFKIGLCPKCAHNVPKPCPSRARTLSLPKFDWKIFTPL